MRVQRLLRRVHAYLGMFLVPWVVVYALSAFVLNHSGWFSPPGDAPGSAAGWTRIWERAYTAAPRDLPDDLDLREHGARILREAGLPTDAYGVFRQGGEVRVTLHGFRRPVRVTHHVAQQRLVAETRENGPSEMLVAMHLTAGYHHSSVLARVWAAGVDAVALSILVWVATGLVLWWSTPAARRWGCAMLALGIASFVWVVGGL